MHSAFRLYVWICVLYICSLIHSSYALHTINTSTSFRKAVNTPSKAKAVSSHKHYASIISQCVNSLDVDIIKYGIAGATAGGIRALSRAVTFPLDTLKTLEQSDQSQLLKEGINISQNKKLSVKQYFSGLVPTVLTAIPANAAFFIVYNILDQLYPCWYSHTYLVHDTTTAIVTALPPIQIEIPSLSDYDKIIQHIVVSTIATIPQNIIKIPGEVIKQRLQTRRGVTMMQLIRDAVSTGGIKALYVGGEAQLLREIPYNVIQFTCYESLKDIIVGTSLALYDSASVAAVLGLIASSIAALITQPIDVIKTKLMTSDDSNNSNNSRGSSKSQSFVQCTIETVRNEGFSGLYVGLIPRLLLVASGGSIYFFILTKVVNT